MFRVVVVLDVERCRKLSIPMYCLSTTCPLQTLAIAFAILDMIDDDDVVLM